MQPFAFKALDVDMQWGISIQKWHQWHGPKGESHIRNIDN